MNAVWDTWKKGFDSWEGATAKLFESFLKSPMILEPAGSALSAAMKAKTARDQAIAKAWAALGLPTRRDQERILHALNQIQSRLLDLEEKLEDSAPGSSSVPPERGRRPSRRAAKKAAPPKKTRATSKRSLRLASLRAQGERSERGGE
jgi:hypothetical protein